MCPPLRIQWFTIGRRARKTGPSGFRDCLKLGEWNVLIEVRFEAARSARAREPLPYRVWIDRPSFGRGHPARTDRFVEADQRIFETVSEA